MARRSATSFKSFVRLNEVYTVVFRIVSVHHHDARHRDQTDTISRFGRTMIAKVINQSNSAVSTK